MNKGGGIVERVIGSVIGVAAVGAFFYFSGLHVGTAIAVFLGIFFSLSNT